MLLGVKGLFETMHGGAVLDYSGSGGWKLLEKYEWWFMIYSCSGSILGWGSGWGNMAPVV